MLPGVKRENLSQAVREHLQRYLDEFEFRYNHQKLEDRTRTVVAIQRVIRTGSCAESQ